jgi:hypothetical protein
MSHRVRSARAPSSLVMVERGWGRLVNTLSVSGGLTMA